MRPGDFKFLRYQESRKGRATVVLNFTCSNPRILHWIDSVPRGSRSEAIREAIEFYLEGAERMDKRVALSIDMIAERDARIRMLERIVNTAQVSAKAKVTDFNQDRLESFSERWRRVEGEEE